MEILGIDVGGTGIKGALVDVATGEMTSKRKRILTPQPATPEAMTDTMVEIVRHFNYQGPIGVGFPAAVQNGVALTAANIDDSWIGFNGAQALAQKTNCPVALVNDADAAGLAEIRFGAGQGEMGVVMVVTLGTGIGTGLFVDGKLVPNTELGHLYLPGHSLDAENWTSERIRIEEGLQWEAWAKRLDAYLHHLEGLFWPTLIILGGGVISDHEKFMPHLTVGMRVVPAQLQNEAGIVGAAMAAVGLADDD